ncbi:YraN family protein [Alkalithermobacter thermoalcaliphilus]|uniref:YraN family protein n=1 Tax=Clostridium paradoxum TaxID=29346 RepID=UPI002FE675C5
MKGLNNVQKGKLGEKIANKYLLSKGFKILDKNYKTRYGEIDLIAQKKEKITFVEVKLRSNLNYGYPCEAVNFKKQNKIRNVATEYINKNKLENLEYSFDVIEVYLKDKKINHIKNAF